MSETARLRFAPSPTGMLHIGGARTALFNWAFARRLGGVFVLRVEDTDPERSTAAYERAILEGLRWLGIEWDEGPDVGGDYGPYRQSDRFPRYAEVARRLEAEGQAYRCFCSAERLTELRERQMAAQETPAYDGRCRELDEAEIARRTEAGESSVLRFRVPEGQTRFRDLIRGDVAFQNADVDDWIMVRSDGSPTYNFVVVCDDTAMGITHVMRGEEHLTNTPKQVLLYTALGLSHPQFAHLPLMLGTDKKKLSKRTGDTALQDYRDKGYPPEAVLNFLCLQGWALDDRTDLFTIEQLVENFDPRDVSKGGAVFDPEKFLWMAGEYVRAESPEQVAERAAPYVVEAGLMDAAELERRSDWFLAVVRTEQERIRIYADLPGRMAYLFAADDQVSYQEKAEKNARKQDDPGGLLKAYLEWLEPRLSGGPIGDVPAEESVAADDLREATRGWVQEQGVKFPALFQPLRCALTGHPGGPDLFEVMALLGAEATRSRIRAGIERLSG